MDLLSLLEGLLIDLDGVVWRGEMLVPGAQTLFEFLKSEGIPFVILSNSSTLTSCQCTEKLGHLGIPVSDDLVLTGTEVITLRLRELAPLGAGVLVIGESGLRKSLIDAGFWLEQDRPDFVVVGLDRDLSYTKLAAAASAVNKGARLIAVNRDVSYPVEGELVPGCGAIVAALEACTSRFAEVVGKPSKEMFRLASNRIEVHGSRLAIVGDALDSDVAGGQQAGIKTILVLTGLATRDAVKESAMQPDAVFDDLEELVECWRLCAGIKLVRG